MWQDSSLKMFLYRRPSRYGPAINMFIIMILYSGGLYFSGVKNSEVLYSSIMSLIELSSIQLGAK